MSKPTCTFSIANVCSGMNAAFLPEAAVAARERVVYCDRMVAVDNDFIGTILLFLRRDRCVASFFHAVGNQFDTIFSIFLQIFN